MLNLVILKQSFCYKGLNTCIAELAIGFTREIKGNGDIKISTVINLHVVVNFYEIT